MKPIRDAYGQRNAQWDGYNKGLGVRPQAGEKQCMAGGKCNRVMDKIKAVAHVAAERKGFCKTGRTNTSVIFVDGQEKECETERSEYFVWSEERKGKYLGAVDIEAAERQTAANRHFRRSGIVDGVVDPTPAANSSQRPSQNTPQKARLVLHGDDRQTDHRHASEEVTGRDHEDARDGIELLRNIMSMLLIDAPIVRNPGSHVSVSVMLPIHSRRPNWDT